MRKKKEQPNLQELFKSYDSPQLNAALRTYEQSLGWDIFKGYLYFMAAYHAGNSLVLAQTSDKTLEACSSAAKAEILRQIADSFMEDLHTQIGGGVRAVESPRPEENEVAS